MFQAEFVEKLNHILSSVTVFENRAVYEIMWKNVVEPGRPQMTTLRMRIVSWKIKATNTHSEYTILLLFRCNNGIPKSSQCYVIRTLPVMLLTFCYP